MGAGRGAAEWRRGLPVERTELRAQALICRPAAPDLAGAPCAQDTAASASLLITSAQFSRTGPMHVHTRVSARGILRRSFGASQIRNAPRCDHRRTHLLGSLAPARA
jgi:hypothetical protein